MPRLVERVTNPFRLKLAVRGVLIAIAALGAGLMPGPSDAQSFDCREARSPDEFLICADPRLARLDEQLSTMYRLQGSRLGREDRELFEQHGTFFINARRRCGDNFRCIEQSYRNRIKEFEDLIAQKDAGGGPAAEVTEAPPERASGRREPHGAAAAKRPATQPAATDAARPGEPGKAAEPTVTPEPAQPAPAPKRQVKRETTATTTMTATAESPQPPPQPASPPAKAGPQRQPSSQTVRASPAPAAASGSSTPPSVTWVDPPAAR